MSSSTDGNQLGDGPIEPGYVRMMNDVAHALDIAFNGNSEGGVDRTTGFVLLVFPYGDDSGRCNYISNGAGRDDIIRLFREQADRFEAGE